MLGFLCYASYNCAYAWSPVVRAQYYDRYHALPAVRTNDIFFAVHAVFATLVTVGQMLVMPGGPHGRVSRHAWALLLVLVVVIGVGGAVAAASPATLSALDYLLGLSYIKLGISLVKYLPQVFLNWRRKSTSGVAIINYLLDFVGGALSVAQLVLDCWATGDWSGIQGDPVKLGLGSASMVYDVAILVQRYVLYPAASSQPPSDKGEEVGEEGGEVVGEEAGDSAPLLRNAVGGAVRG